MDEFDFIIVGAGSAGCALANRLSANPDHRVLLLEAGGEDRNIAYRIPMALSYLMSNEKHAWQYNARQNEQADSKSYNWPRGKALGGSSSINGMIYIRGQARDYDGWRQLGNPGWGWDDVLPYFKRLENYEPGENAFHGAGGPIDVATTPNRLPVCDAVVEAGQQAGIRYKFDINDGDQEGISYYHFTIGNGVRSSASRGYLRPIRDRKNLTILTRALASRIVVENKRATAVEFEHEGRLRQARARKEIILSGGAINSPQLLQLSGIGPGALLKVHGIDVVHDVPGVGENLQDHVSSLLLYRIKNSRTLNSLTRGLPLVGEVGKWLTRRQGFFGKGPAYVQVFARSRPELETPDIQLHVNPMSQDLEVYEKDVTLKLEEQEGITLIPCQLRPESRGWIRIQSPDFKRHPDIVANYLSHPLDEEVAIAATRLCRKIMAQPALEPFVEFETIPGGAIETDEQILDHYRANLTTLYHPVGTCKMGPAQDSMAVVDPELKVHGIEGLRVADASIMPRLASGNTNAPSMMIGEKASDLVLSRWG